MYLKTRRVIVNSDLIQAVSVAGCGYLVCNIKEEKKKSTAAYLSTAKKIQPLQINLSDFGSYANSLGLNS